MDYETYQSWKITREGRVVTVSLNRPEIRNAIDAGFHRELGRISSTLTWMTSVTSPY